MHVVVGGRAHAGAVEFQEDGGREPAEALVAVDERMVSDDRVEQSGGLGPDARARRAASCMDVPSSAARRLRASCSSSVSRSVIAMPEDGIRSGPGQQRTRRHRANPKESLYIIEKHKPSEFSLILIIARYCLPSAICSAAAPRGMGRPLRTVWLTKVRVGHPKATE